MVLRLLQFLLILAVVRAVWRLGKGVLEGAGYRRVDGPARVGVKLERDPVCGTYVSPSQSARAEDWRRDALFLLGQVPARVGAPMIRRASVDG